MNKRNLFEKKYIIRLLILILGKDNTNKRISILLKKDPSTISEQLDYLQTKRIVYLISNKKKRYNEKEYGVDCKKIAEFFLRYYVNKKQLIKFKNNDLVLLTFAMLIFSKKENKEIDKITLLDIFKDADTFFLHRALLMRDKKDFLEMFTFKENKEETKAEFKEFLGLFYTDYKEKLEKLNKEILKASNIPKTQQNKREIKKEK